VSKVRKGRSFRKFSWLFFFSFLTFNFLTSHLFSASWEKWKKDIYASNYNKETANNIEESSLVWEYNTFSNILASPILKGDYLYICTRSGAVYCFNALTGDVVWQVSVGGQINSTPLIEDNKLYVASFDGNIYSFNASTGEEEWNYSTTSAETFSSPLVFENMLIYAPGFGNSDYEDYLVSLDLNGNFKWRFNTGNLIHSSPFTDGTYIYIASNNGKLFKLDTLGNEIWNYQTDGSFRMATPSYKDGKIFFAPGDNERRVFALNNSGSIFWVSNQLNTSGEGLIPSSIAIDEENLYLVYTTTKEWIAALKQNNGNILWQIDLGEKQASNYIASPSVLNGSIFIPTQSGYLFEISTSGVINNSFLVNTSSSPVYTTPAISNGKLYLATWSGIVKCYQAEEVVSISYPDKDTVSGLVGIKGYIKSSSSLNWTIYYSTDNLNFTEISTGTSQVNGTVIVDWDTNLLSDGTYYLKISANNGDAYNRCILDNPPSPPQNLTAIDNPSDDGGAILLSWSKSLDDGTGSDDVQGYKIYRSTLPFTLYTLHLTLLKGTTYYKDSGLTDYLTYYYYIKSYDSFCFRLSLRRFISSAANKFLYNSRRWFNRFILEFFSKQ